MASLGLRSPTQVKSYLGCLPAARTLDKPLSSSEPRSPHLSDETLIPVSGSC